MQAFGAHGNDARILVRSIAHANTGWFYHKRALEGWLAGDWRASERNNRWSEGGDRKYHGADEQCGKDKGRNRQMKMYCPKSTNGTCTRTYCSHHQPHQLLKLCNRRCGNRFRGSRERCLTEAQMVAQTLIGENPAKVYADDGVQKWKA